MLIIFSSYCTRECLAHLATETASYREKISDAKTRRGVPAHVTNKQRGCPHSFFFLFFD